MRAIQIQTLDGPDAISLVDVAEPPQNDAVLINVAFAGVTFPEVLLSRGEYQMKPDLPFVPGSEVSGTVRWAPLGAHVAIGDRVAAFPMWGGFAEVAAAPPSMVFRIPDSLEFAEAAALPMNYLTMHFALQRRAHLRADETVLVHGAAGGIGTAAIQLAVAYGCRVIAVTSTPEKAEVARQAGAHEVVDAANFRDEVKELTGGRGVGVVVDPVGGDRFTDSLRCLGREGRLLVIGFTGGSIPEVKVNRLLLNNISVVGVGWGMFWLSDPEYLQQQWRELQPLLTAGRLNPVIGQIFDLADAAQALNALDQRRALGKVLLRI